MECAAKGRRTPCVGPATRRCARCEAVSYCSIGHQTAHWTHHKQECERLEKQMKNVDELNEFPFTFSREATCQHETRFILAKRHLHRVGMSMHECQCGASCASFDRLNEGWDLSSYFCPCSGPESPISEVLHSWEDYYKWSCIPLDSPAALLLHWLVRIKIPNPEISDKLFIHYLGAEKELLQLAVFGELQALFPGIRVHVELVGPAIPLHSEQGWREDQYFSVCSLQ